MSHHDKKQGNQKPMTDDKTKQPQQQQEPMPRAHERDRQDVPGERSDKESIGQPVQLDREERQ